MKLLLLFPLCLFFITACGAEDSSDVLDAVDQADQTEGAECEPSCHWDCWAGYGCLDGLVWAYGSGPRDCCHTGEPWPGGGPTCSVGVAYTCEANCGYPESRYSNENSHVDSELPDHLLRLYCAEGRPKAAGDPCTVDQDCRPAAGDPAPRLVCESGACVAIERPVVEGLGRDCGLDLLPLPSQGRYETQLRQGRTCELCLTNADQDDCLRQACTARCEFDEDCPNGFSCVLLAPERYGVEVQQFCVEVTGDARYTWTDGLSCPAESCCQPPDSPCTTNAECCSGVCDPATQLCASCGAESAACSNDAECCTGSCDLSTGRCAARDDGASCDQGDQCASGFCDRVRGLCTVCKSDGSACGELGECCNGLCDLGQQSCPGCLPELLAGCTQDSDCCTGRCDPGTTRCLQCRPRTSPCDVDADCCSNHCGYAGCLSADFATETGLPCSADAGCWNEACDLSRGVCEVRADGEPCYIDVQCASNHCGLYGTCEPLSCRADWDACATAGNCCSGLCSDQGQCLPCALDGASCTANATCCSGSCGSNNLCTLPDCGVGP